jgi:UDP-GlcNAc:undecaprenyl-phosphate GlcNAc-1-phosphate transferase
MNISWGILYGAVFIQALVLSLILTPVAGRVGFRLRLVDVPHEKKIHQEAKARSGGLAIFASFMVVILGDLLLLGPVSQRIGLFSADVLRFFSNIPGIVPKLAAILIGGTIVFLVGLIDDRYGLRPYQKLVLQVAATVPLILVNIRIVMFVPSALIGGLLTVLWVVLLTNSFNLLDNMDGLCSGVATIILCVLAFVSYRSGELFMVAIFLALAGSVLGFLRYNFYPARLFMGDGGSLFVGYMIGALTILSTYYHQGIPTGLPVLMPLIILGVPIFDTVTVVLIRLKNRKPILQGDTNHFSHRLVSIGMSQPEAVVFIYLVTLCVALGALALQSLRLGQTVLLFVLIFLLERVTRKKVTDTKIRDK